MRWRDTITDSMDVGLSKLWEVGDGQGGLACCSPLGHKESGTTERLSRTETAGLPRGLSGKEFACQCRRHRRCGFHPCIKREMATPSAILAWKIP